MNSKQKICLLAGIAVVVAMGLFPPWVVESKELYAGKPKYTLKPGPYSWIGSPPVIREERQAYYYAGEKRMHNLTVTPRFVDLYRLSVQYFIAAAVTAGLIVILSSRKGSK